MNEELENLTMEELQERLAASNEHLESFAERKEGVQASLTDMNNQVAEARKNVKAAKAHAEKADATDEDKATSEQWNAHLAGLLEQVAQIKDAKKQLTIDERNTKKSVKEFEKLIKAKQRQLDKEAKAAAKAEAKEASKMPEQNGVRMPRPGSKTRFVWDVATKISEDSGTPATRKDVVAECEKEGINMHTILTQYSQWRKFHGIVGRVVEPAPAPAAPEAPETTEA